MEQTITDFRTFLSDAKGALLEVAELVKQEEALNQEELRTGRTLEAEKKAVQDTVESTVNKRRSEIESSYDAEIGKQQDKLKKARSRREKAKNQGMKDRIREETQELRESSRELKIRMQTLFQGDHVPFFCNTGYFYALYFPKSFREVMILLLTLAVCFLFIPYGIYLLLPVKKTIYLALIYGASILVFGGIYILIGNRMREHHMEALKEGRRIRTAIASNRRKIRVITGSIKRDRSEDVYDLDKYDDEIAQLEQDLDQITLKKKETLNTFENVNKTIITDEINGNSRAKLEELEQAYQEAQGRLRYTETLLKEKRMYITDTYECYLGKEFLVPEKLDELKNILETDTAVNLTEAMEVYRERIKNKK